MSDNKKLISALLNLATGNICDANGKKGAMDPGIKPLDQSFRMAGPAFTADCQPGDNLTIHRAIAAAPPDAVLVVNISAFSYAGHFGEIMAQACKQRGLAGVVIDGGCRDSADLCDMGLPVFCRGVSPNGTVKASAGAINEAIVCGGVAVNPGDIVVGDRDGVVVIAAAQAEHVVERARAIVAREKEIKEQIAQGKTTLEILGLA